MSELNKFKSVLTSKFFILLIILAAVTGSISGSYFNATKASIVESSDNTVVINDVSCSETVNPRHGVINTFLKNIVDTDEVHASTSENRYCEGYNVLNGETTQPFNVKDYLQINVSASFLAGSNGISSATVYVAPATGTIPEWTPAIVNKYKPSTALTYGKSVTVYNAYSNAFPVITKKCSSSTNDGTRGFRVHVEIRDENGIAYRSNSLYLYISPEKIINPPVSDSGQICNIGG